MNSSGIKRGLATTAVAALAVTGVPFIATTAHAVPLNSSVASASSVYLVAPDTSSVSARNDGANTTVRLEAVGGNDVAQVRFQYSLNSTTGADGDWTAISTVSRNDNGAFSYEWDPSAVAGGTVFVRALPLNAAGAAITVADATTNSQQITVNNTNVSVNVTDGEAIGVFQQPYTTAGDTDQNVIVSGTSSDTSATPGLSFWDADTDGGASDNQPGYAGAGTTTSTTPTNATTGSWAGVLDIAGYEYGGTDQLLVKATGATTDDAEAFNLYRQRITSVSAEAERTNVPAGSAAVPVTVTVIDQNGRPIAGARVASSDGVQVDMTDANGEASFSQGPGTAYYYADATDQTGYQAELNDQRSETVTITQYAAAPTTLTGKSDNGPAFDVDEYDANDISVQVTDQNGNKIDTTGQPLQYYWVFTPFAGGTPTRTPSTGTDAVVTSTDGEYEVPLPTGFAAQEGTYELFAGLGADALGNNAIASAKQLTVKAGEATVDFTASEPQTAAAGGEMTVSGTLTLDDGTALPGRRINLAYTGGDAAFDQPTGPDASPLVVTTNADGAFSGTLDDPTATPQTTESGTVTATTADYPDPADSGNVDNANASATQNVVFAQSDTPAGSTVVISAIADGAGSEGTPGVAESGSVTVRDANNVAIANQLVTLTVDGDSFFTDGTPESLPTTVNGVAGDLKSLGKEITVVTNGSGVANFQVAVERSEEFDDDGLAEDIVTATAGAATDTEDVDYSSANPLNGGAVRIEFSPASEQAPGNNLPQARPGTDVEFDVFTEDQFGNLVGGELVTIADNTTDAEVEGVDADTTAAGLQIESDFDTNGDFSATADEVEDQIITATWSAPVYTYDNTSGTASAKANRNLTDSIEVNWADVEIDREATTMTSSASSEPVAVGTAVTETVTVVDVDGNPVPGVLVEFTQAGPGAANSSVTRVTNAQGQAFYTFIGATEGDAFITAEVETGGEPIVLSDTVTFGETGPKPIVVALKAQNNGAKPDRLRIITKEDDAAGAAVRVVRINKNGKRVVLDRSTLNANGNYVTTVKDRNGKKFSRYIAVVKKTDLTRGGKSNIKRVR